MRWAPEEATCAECGFDWAIEPDEAIGIIEVLPARLTALFEQGSFGPPPTAGRWSARGHLWHLVDVLRIGTERLLTVRYDPEAGITCWDEKALAETRQYERLSPVAGLHALRSAAAGWTLEARSTPEAAVTVHPEFGELAAADLIRRNAHEAVHHQLDIRRDFGRVATRRQGLAVLALTRRSASAWMLVKEARTAASQAAATRSAHHWPATPKSVPSSPEYSSWVVPSSSVSVNSSVRYGTGPRTSRNAIRCGRSKV